MITLRLLFCFLKLKDVALSEKLAKWDMCGLKERSINFATGSSEMLWYAYKSAS